VETYDRQPSAAVPAQTEPAAMTAVARRFGCSVSNQDLALAAPLRSGTGAGDGPVPAGPCRLPGKAASVALVAAYR
jgi:hypothetical protein